MNGKYAVLEWHRGAQSIWVKIMRVVDHHDERPRKTAAVFLPLNFEAAEYFQERPPHQPCCPP